MLKRLFDISFSLVIIISLSPVILVALLAVWAEDKRSPFYFASRVGKNNIDFKMIKIRSMRVGADKTGVNSTSSDDARITRAGRIIRKYKIDEISQFFNVLIGNMSVVGPRPNTRNLGVDLYSPREMDLLKVKPGITDLASIVFADEGDILLGSKDPDKYYNLTIRPWKSELSLFCIKRSNFFLDLKICYLTALSIVSREVALRHLNNVLTTYNCDENLVKVALRDRPIEDYVYD